MDIWMIISKIKNLASKALILNHLLLLIIRVVIIKSKFDNSANKNGVRYAKALGFFKISSEINKLKSINTNYKEEEPSQQSSQFSQFKKTQIKPPEHNFTICFWCLNPAVVN